MIKKFLLILLTILLGVCLAIQGKNYIWYWMFGLGFGFILQRSRICFVSATSEPIITGSTEQFRAILIGILVSSFGITIIKYLSGGTLDMLGVSAISIPLIIGAFFFGLGMILSGCCTSSIFIRLAEGYTIHLFTFTGIIAGYLIANSHYQTLWTPLIKNAPVIFLPAELGWHTGIIVHILIIVLLYFVAVKREQDISSSNSTTYLKGALLLGILNVIHHMVFNSGWSVTGAFFWLTSDKDMFSITIGPNIRNIGMFMGAFFSVFICTKFKFKKVRSVKQILISVIGGLFMGYGIRISGGCNISLFFTGAASLSLSAWVFMIFLFFGTFVGTKILYKLL